MKSQTNPKTGEPRTVQAEFISRLKTVIPPNHSLVDELADILQVSTDSAYRRIRGETALTIDEVSRLCSHYRIPFDHGAVKNGKASVTFSYHHLSDNSSNFIDYLNSVVSDLKRIKATEPNEIIFAAEDIPIFHHFRFPLLTAFKLFYWSKSILNVPEMEELRFDPASVPEKPVKLVREIYSLYQTIPSIEIWTEETLDSTLKQVEYYYESGLFQSKEQAIELLAEIGKMIAGVEKQAALSMKFTGDVPDANSNVNYSLYNSDLMMGNNCILVTAGGARFTYLVHNTFNSMLTTSQSFNEETERWLRNLIRKSNPLSGVSEKQRFRFFKKLNDKIARTREGISAG
ncbi:MAG TPA: hypothetical protein VFU15_17405 [Bacteroidia bacterium]|nr:hypothetical protein [Bacteroidia bacterium]